MKPIPPYNHEACDNWERVVFCHFKRELRGRPRAFVLALRSAERNRYGGGFCKPIVGNHADLAVEFGVSKNTFGPTIDRLKNIVVEVQMGQAVIGGAGTQLRRLTLDEIRSGAPASVLRRHTPDVAEQVASVLRSRPFMWNGQPTTPTYDVKRTGRIYTKRPNVQNVTGRTAARLQALSIGLPAGHVAFEVDFCKAEPTVLRHILTAQGCKLPWPADPYQALATITGLTRDECKLMVMKVAYSPNTKAALMSIAPAAIDDSFFGPWAKAVDEYKRHLKATGKPLDKRDRRHVVTLGGTRIESLKGDNIHAGKLLAWQVQGTVGDILNRALVRVFTMEQANGFNVAFPVHDSVCCVGRGEAATGIAEVMEGEADKMGLKMQAEVKTEP